MRRKLNNNEIFCKLEDQDNGVINLDSTVKYDTEFYLDQISNDVLDPVK